MSRTVLNACSLVSSIAGSRDGCGGLWWTPEAAISALSPCSEGIRDIWERQRLRDYVWKEKTLYAGHGVKLEMASLYPSTTVHGINSTAYAPSLRCARKQIERCWTDDIALQGIGTYSTDKRIRFNRGESKPRYRPK